MDKEVLELLDMLYTMVTEAWGVPLGNDRCIIEREKALNLLGEIKARLPNEMAEAKRIVGIRDEYVGNAKREAEAVLRSAQERAQELIDEQEIVRAAKQQSANMLSTAENRSRELYRVANAYVDDLLGRTDEAVNASLLRVRETRAAFRTASAGLARGARPAQPAAQRIEVDESDEFTQN